MPVTAMGGLHDLRNVGFRFRATWRGGRGEQGDHEQRHTCRDPWEVRFWLSWDQSCTRLAASSPRWKLKTYSQGGANVGMWRFRLDAQKSATASLALGSQRMLCGEWNLPFALSWRRS